MYHYYAHMIAALGLFLAVLALLPTQARSDDRKDIARDKLTEFCAVVGKPPQQIAAGINQMIEADPQTWVPIATWWNRIVAAYEKNGCGNA